MKEEIYDFEMDKKMELEWERQDEAYEQYLSMNKDWLKDEFIKENKDAICDDICPDKFYEFCQEAFKEDQRETSERWKELDRRN